MWEQAASSSATGGTEGRLQAGAPAALSHKASPTHGSHRWGGKEIKELQSRFVVSAGGRAAKPAVLGRGDPQQLGISPGLYCSAGKTIPGHLKIQPVCTGCPGKAALPRVISALF